MSEIQNGLGATPERMKKSKIVTIETVNAGQFAQRERWPDVVAFMLDRGMLAVEMGYGWDDYCRLKHGMAGSGSGGEGWKQQEWIRFQKILGYMHLRVLHELADYPIPQDGEEVDEIVWRLNVCKGRVRDALSASSKAAQEARKEIDGHMRTQNGQNVS